MPSITIRFFATIRDRAGVSELALDLPNDATVADLLDRLRADLPAVAPLLDTSLIAVNEEFAFPNDVIPGNSTVAIFPPVSGGMGSPWPEVIRVTPDALDIDAILARITTPETGGICTFSGAVRGITAASDAATAYLHYEAYESMAEAKLRQVACEIRERYPRVQGIALIQRLGHLDVGQVTVMVACAAAHRDHDIFEAARYGIDRLKEIVPVWKKEVSSDGDPRWIEGSYRPTPADREGE